MSSPRELTLRITVLGVHQQRRNGNEHGFEPLPRQPYIMSESVPIDGLDNGNVLCVAVEPRHKSRLHVELFEHVRHFGCLGQHPQCFSHVFTSKVGHGIVNSQPRKGLYSGRVDDGVCKVFILKPSA